MSILITGGTGSFGRAFVERLLLGNIKRICVFSRGEHAQADMRFSLNDNKRLRWFIGDVRDGDRLRRAMEDVRIVVHAAALKRIEVGAYNPIEMVKTNVFGAINVIEAALDCRVSRVVALSTDKAYHPISPYGQTKALMEGLMGAANNMTRADGPRFSVIRYGNVAGSNGSVIPLWKKQLTEQGHVTVTDPDCTRFWMTMDDAIDLVLWTIENMPEKVTFPTLSAFRLGDLAEAMDADMVVTGLPEWEKKHENLDDRLSSNNALRLSVPELKEKLKTL